MGSLVGRLELFFVSLVALLGSREALVGLVDSVSLPLVETLWVPKFADNSTTHFLGVDGHLNLNLELPSKQRDLPASQIRSMDKTLWGS